MNIIFNDDVYCFLFFNLHNLDHSCTTFKSDDILRNVFSNSRNNAIMNTYTIQQNRDYSFTYEF